MKTILKTLPRELELKYDEKFGSEANADALRQIIPRLMDAMKSKYDVTYKELRGWLASLHKHRRIRHLYQERGVLDKDNRRLHRNSRTAEVKKIGCVFSKNLLTFVM
jgi:hypothetical protein